MNGKSIAQEGAVDKQWADFVKQLNEIIQIFGCLLFSPVIILVGAAYGIKIGLVAGIEKTLRLLRRWGK